MIWFEGVGLSCEMDLCLFPAKQKPLEAALIMNTKKPAFNTRSNPKSLLRCHVAKAKSSDRCPSDTAMETGCPDCA